MKIVVLGGGSWGTALAHLFAVKNRDTHLLVRDNAVAMAITQTRENARYLPGLSLAPSLRITSNPEQVLPDASICVLAIPCQHLRFVLDEFRDFFSPSAVFICASKGIEVSQRLFMSQVVAEVLPDYADRYAILSGPSFAQEVLQGKPTAVALGCADSQLGIYLQGICSSPLFRVYCTTDVRGVELGGAVKNVISIAAGVCDGLDLGDNARAGLITRGLAEMSRLGGRLGAQPATLMGLSGLGDLVLTCTGNLSRNRQVGLRLGRGEALEDILRSMHNVAEGIPTTRAVCDLAEGCQMELPIAQAVYRILYEGAKPVDSVTELMSRALREE